MNTVNRRHFLKTVSILGAASMIPYHSFVQADASEGGQWYRGNLHTHSQWSDGSPMPEWAVDWYKQRGYHFLCLSDHNIFQNDELRFDAWCGACKRPDNDFFKTQNSRWKQIENAGWAKLSAKSIAQAAEKFGMGSLTSFQEGNDSWYRLKTFDELSKQFVEPGKFILIPGFEQTGQSEDKRQVHMNFINVSSFFPYISAADAPQTVNANFAKGLEFFKDAPGPVMYTLNHPLWPYYDVDPQILIDNADIRFFELNNNGISYPHHAQGWLPDMYWDVVNAFRVLEGKQLLLGTGSDDEHTYESPTPRAWMMVRSEKLEFPSLYAAMQRGDFFATNGLDFETIRFDRDSGTLFVKVKPQEGVSYRIEFIGTKKNFDRKCEFVNIEAEGKIPARKLSTWSKEIGTTLKSVDGIEASYTLTNDDLYVRAQITAIRTGEAELQDKLLRKPAAWSQPYSKMVK